MDIKRKFDFAIRGTSNKYLTVSLFKETANFPEDAVFTLNTDDIEYEGKTYPSLYRIYQQYMDDPTEYLFAMEVFGEFKIWKLISETPRIKPYVESWREEMEARLKSQAILQLREQASNGSSTAARWLSESGWKPKKSGPKSKTEAKKEERVQEGVEEHVKQHLTRLRKVHG